MSVDEGETGVGTAFGECEQLDVVGGVEEVSDGYRQAETFCRAAMFSSFG